MLVYSTPSLGRSGVCWRSCIEGSLMYEISSPKMSANLMLPILAAVIPARAAEGNAWIGGVKMSPPPSDDESFDGVVWLWCIPKLNLWYKGLIIYVPLMNSSFCSSRSVVVCLDISSIDWTVCPLLFIAWMLRVDRDFIESRLFLEWDSFFFFLSIILFWRSSYCYLSSLFITFYDCSLII